MHIYAFGSICRGDLTIDSDIDLLALVVGYDDRLDPEKFSIYSYRRMSELWDMGNAYAWHLHLESRLVFADDGVDYLASQGAPAPYKKAAIDCNRFQQLFESAHEALENGSQSVVFELSTVFLSIRNIATCYSLGVRKEANFGRDAALRLGPLRVPLSNDAYQILRRARILSTRGIGDYIQHEEVLIILNECHRIYTWIAEITREVRLYG